MTSLLPTPMQVQMRLAVRIILMQVRQYGIDLSPKGPDEAWRIVVGVSRGMQRVVGIDSHDRSTSSLKVQEEVRDENCCDTAGQ